MFILGSGVDRIKVYIFIGVRLVLIKLIEIYILIGVEEVCV